MKFKGNIDSSGKMRIYHVERFKELKDSLRGKQIELTLDVAKKEVSGKQRGYLHGCVLPFLDKGFHKIGYPFTKNQIYEWFKSNFCYKEVLIETTGEIIKVPLDISKNGDATTRDLNDAIDRVKLWAAENLETYIPDPNEQLSIDSNI